MLKVNSAASEFFASESAIVKPIVRCLYALYYKFRTITMYPMFGIPGRGDNESKPGSSPPEIQIKIKRVPRSNYTPVRIRKKPLESF